MEFTGSYTDPRYDWKIDGLFFNRDRTKLFGWILKINLEEKGDVLDFVEYFTGEKRDGLWYYYIHHMPGTFFSHADNGNKPYDFEYLSNYAKKEVLEGGIINTFNCGIDDDYINGWTDREGRNLYRYHIKWLKGIE